MAERKVTLTLLAKDKASAAIRKAANALTGFIGKMMKSQNVAARMARSVGRSFTKAKNAMVAFGDKGASAFNKVKGSIVAFTATIGVAIFAAGRMIRAFNAQDVAVRKLGASMQLVGRAAGDSTDRMVKLSDALAQKTGIDADQITNAQALLRTFAISGQTVEKLIPKVLDMSVSVAALSGGMIDLRGATQAIGKAFTSGVGMLSRYGVAMSKVEMKTFQAGDQATKINTLLKILDNNFRGIAEGAGRGFEGRVRALGEQFMRVIKLGGEMMTRVLMPLVNVVSRGFTAFGELSEGTQRATVGIGILGAALGTLLLAAIPLAAILSTGLLPALWAVLVPMGILVAKVLLVTLAVGGVVAGVVAMGKIMMDTWPAIVALIVTSARSIGNIMANLGKLILAALSGDIEGIKSAWDQTKGAIAGAVDGVKEKAVDLGIAVAGSVEGMRKKVVKSWTSMTKAIGGLLKKQTKNVDKANKDQTDSTGKAMTDQTNQRFIAAASWKAINDEVARGILSVMQTANQSIVNSIFEMTKAGRGNLRDFLASVVEAVGRAAAQQILAWFAVGAAKEVATKGYAGIASGAALLIAGVAAAAAVSVAAGLAVRAIQGGRLEDTTPAPTLPTTPLPGSVGFNQSSTVGGTTRVPSVTTPSATEEELGAPPEDEERGAGNIVNIFVRGDDPDLARRIGQEVRQELALLENA